VSELTAKYSSLLETHNNTLDENSRLQREVVRLQTENRRLMETAAQQQAAFENEANSADAVTATNIRLMDELASERRYVQRMARDRDELEADFKKREADFVAVVEEDSRRMTKALEVLQSKLESKNKTLESKLDEISRLKAHIFSLETAINRVEAAFPGDIALAAALKDVPDRIHSLEKPMTPPSRSDQSIAPALNSESVQESEKVENKVSQEGMPYYIQFAYGVCLICRTHFCREKQAIRRNSSAARDYLSSFA
jgi:chromosome segregation ATPase